MEFEVLKRSHVKRNIIIGVVVVFIISAIILNFTSAKYRTSYSVPLINGEVNYKVPDLNIVSLYVSNEEGEYVEADTIPTGNYELSEESYCEINGVKNDNINLTYDSNTQTLNVKPFTTKGTKCYLYFDKGVLAKDTILANYPTVLTRNDFSTAVTNTTTGTIYKSLDESQYDNDGEVYYFAGNPTDNWVSFAGFYWRIVRVNGDGSIRLIYNGTGPATTGEGTQITLDGSNVFAFNRLYNDNAYVGFKYSIGNVHGTETNSDILITLNAWYQNNLTSYANYIDINAGFCNDREPSTNTSNSNGLGGTGITETFYASNIRISSNNMPSFKCINSSDLFTLSNSSKGNKSLNYPIGLITADELIYAGLTSEEKNENYYLYTGHSYWTLSPAYFSGKTLIYTMSYLGHLSVTSTYDNSPGIRPEINLSPNVKITGIGTSSDPYQVS